MVKINTYEDLVQAFKNKEPVHSSVYARLNVQLYDTYLEVFGTHYCKNCNKELTREHFTGLKDGFKECCCIDCTNLYRYGVKCTLNKPGANENFKKAFFEKHGVTNPSQLDWVKQKKKDNFIEKHGVDNPAHLESVKQKKKETNLAKYGVEYFSQSEEFNIKVKETSLDKYGVEHFTQSKEYKETRAKKIHYAQLNITNFKDYNQEFIENNFIQNNKFQMFEAMRYFNVGSTILHRRFDIPKTISVSESELLSLVPDSISNDRQFIAPLEIDILNHKHKFGIEYNGLMWHSSGTENSKFPTTFDKNYHLNKTELIEQKGYKLFHIFENEWLNTNKKEIWISIIKQELNINLIIDANELDLKFVDFKIALNFLEHNSLDKIENLDECIILGLFNNDEVLYLIVFKERINREFEILHITNKKNTKINNAYNKILKLFKNKYNPKVLSYKANRRWNNSKDYLDLGFNVKQIIEPVGFYFKSNLELFTSDENLLDEGYRKIYDCGYIIFENII